MNKLHRAVIVYDDGKKITKTVFILWDGSQVSVEGTATARV